MNSLLEIASEDRTLAGVIDTLVSWCLNTGLKVVNLLPAHGVRRVYVFFPDPWPKRKHHSHRLFGPLFLDALWKRLEIGGKLEFATDHAEYFGVVCECFAANPRFKRVEPMPRPKEVWTEFETMFREKGMEVYSAAWQSLEADDKPLEPLKIPPEAEPREGIARRYSQP